jgi:hypothetical protein
MHMDATGVIRSSMVVIIVPILAAVAPMRYRSLETRRMPIAVFFMTRRHLIMTQEKDAPYFANRPRELKRRTTAMRLVERTETRVRFTVIENRPIVTRNTPDLDFVALAVLVAVLVMIYVIYEVNSM